MPDVRYTAELSQDSRCILVTLENTGSEAYEFRCLQTSVHFMFRFGIVSNRHGKRLCADNGLCAIPSIRGPWLLPSSSCMRVYLHLEWYPLWTEVGGWYFSTHFKEQLTFELAAFERVGPPLLLPSCYMMKKRA